MTNRRKYKILAEKLKTSVGRSGIAASMLKPISEEERTKSDMKYRYLAKQMKANFYSQSDAYKEELEYEKTAPKRDWGFCGQCEYFSKAMERFKPNKVLKDRYNCQKHSQAVVQEEISAEKWKEMPLPFECPFYVEVRLREWNMEELNEEDKS